MKINNFQGELTDISAERKHCTEPTAEHNATALAQLDAQLAQHVNKLLHNIIAL